MKKTITLVIDVIVPAKTGESEVEKALNSALDEPTCDWGGWTVGGFSVLKVEKGNTWKK